MPKRLEAGPGCPKGRQIHTQRWGPQYRVAGVANDPSTKVAGQQLILQGDKPHSGGRKGLETTSFRGGNREKLGTI